MFTLGEIVPIVVETRSAALALEADTLVQVTITPATGAALGPFTATLVSVGKYQYNWTASVVGRSTWSGTTATHGIVPGDVIDVQPLAATGLMSLAGARSQLNLSSTVNDSELRLFIAAATAVVEDIVGPVIPRVVTEQHTGASIMLNEYPVISVTSIAPYSAALGGTSYVTAELLVSQLGLVELASGSSFSASTRTVVYVAGRAIIPPAISLAARIIVQHLWDTQRGGSNLPLADDGMVVGAGWAVPRRAIELLEPFRKSPGVA